MEGTLSEGKVKSCRGGDGELAEVLGEESDEKVSRIYKLYRDLTEVECG